MTTRRDPIGFALLVRTGVLRVVARVESEDIPGLIGDYEAEVPLADLEARGFRLDRQPLHVGDHVKVFAFEP